MRPYILLTPGPLTTSETVKQAMMSDWCTWDDDYNIGIVQKIRKELVELAASDTSDYTAVLMQGSGSFCVESAIGTTVRPEDTLLIAANGAYGERMGKIAEYYGINYNLMKFDETSAVDPAAIEKYLDEHEEVTHVSVVHCETTTGILNPISEISEVVKKHGKIFIVDAMSSFGGVPIDMSSLGIDVLISSANKCIQGVPGFGFVIIRRSLLEKCKGVARSLSLDLYDQWNTMESGHGKWRFTSPTHVVRAFMQALEELKAEGGVEARHRRYCENHRVLVDGMRKIGFKTLLPDNIQSPVITSFLYSCNDFDFKKFYGELKNEGFVIYPGKISQADTFRIGNIGDVFPDDFKKLTDTISRILA